MAEEQNVRDIDVYVNAGFSGNDEEMDYVKSVNGMQGVVTINKSTVGLEKVDNTSDMDKPVSTAQQTALNSKANTREVEDLTTRVSTLEGNVSDLSDALKETNTDVSGKLGVNENAVSATKLQIARKINGVDFDGMGDITITADPNAHNHIVEMTPETIVDVAERTSDKIYYNVTENTSVTNGTSTVSNMSLV